MRLRTQGWDENAARAFLGDSRVPVRLAVLAADGSPRLVSLWFEWDGEALWCASQRDSVVVRLLTSRPECAFEISTNAPPYRGVRGTALASLDDGAGGTRLERLLSRYLTDRNAPLREWLLSRSDDDVAIRLEPGDCFAWDFSGRMVAEQD